MNPFLPFRALCRFPVYSRFYGCRDRYRSAPLSLAPVGVVAIDAGIRGIRKAVLRFRTKPGTVPVPRLQARQHPA
jgi:hypothetical protein